MNKKIFLLSMSLFFITITIKSNNLNERLSQILEKDPFLKMTSEEKARTCKEIAAKHPAYTRAVGLFLWIPTVTAAQSVNWGETFKNFNNIEELFYFVSQLKYKDVSIANIITQEKFESIRKKIIELCEERIQEFEKNEPITLDFLSCSEKDKGLETTEKVMKVFEKSTPSSKEFDYLMINFS